MKRAAAAVFLLQLPVSRLTGDKCHIRLSCLTIDLLLNIC